MAVESAARERPPQEHLDRAAAALRRGGVVAHACEGVWGLACDPFQRPAVLKALAVKSRPAAKGLIVIAADASRFAPELAALEAELAERVRATWPGATTWVLPNRRFPAWITGDRATVAVRVPGHAQARALAAAFGGPLASTSANRAGAPPARTAQAVAAVLGGAIDYLLPGAVGDRDGPSRIVDAASLEAIR